MKAVLENSYLVNPVFPFSSSVVVNTLVDKLDRRTKKVHKGVGHSLTKCMVDSVDSTLPPQPDAQLGP